jgi:solute carrier family 35 protein F5
MRSLLHHLDTSDPTAEEQRILEHAIVNEGGSSEDELEDTDEPSQRGVHAAMEEKEPSRLGLRATARLSFQFCMLWVRIPHRLYGVN